MNKCTDPSSRSRTGDILAVTLALVLPTGITWVYFVLLADSAPSLQQTAYGIGKVLQFALPVVWVMGMQRKRLGLKWPDTRGLGTGLAFGMLVFAAAMALYHGWLKPGGYFEGPGEIIHQKVRGFSVDSFWPYVALGAFYSICHSFLEEYYWRWFVFGQLRRLVPWKVAVAVSSVGFMAHHVLVLAFYFGWRSPATAFFSVSVAVGGAVWAWLYHRSQSLYAPWLSHLVIDAVIFIVGYDLVRPFFGQ